MKKTHKLLFDNKFPLLIVEEKRNNARIALNKQYITIRLPQHLSESKKTKLLKQFYDWLKNKHLLLEQKYGNNLSEYENKTIDIHGNKYIYIITQGNYNFLQVQDNKLNITLSQHDFLAQNTTIIQSLVENYFIELYTPWLIEQVEKYNDNTVQQKINSIKFTKAHSKWGSCSPQKKILISIRLLLAPIEVFKYVCIHELCHLIHMNHSKQFWNLVEQHMYDYKQHHQFLKNNKELLMF